MTFQLEFIIPDIFMVDLNVITNLSWYMENWKKYVVNTLVMWHEFSWACALNTEFVSWNYFTRKCENTEITAWHKAIRKTIYLHSKSVAPESWRWHYNEKYFLKDMISFPKRVIRNANWISQTRFFSLLTATLIRLLDRLLIVFKEKRFYIHHLTTGN